MFQDTLVSLYCQIKHHSQLLYYQMYIKNNAKSQVILTIRNTLCVNNIFWIIAFMFSVFSSSQFLIELFRAKTFSYICVTYNNMPLIQICKTASCAHCYFSIHFTAVTNLITGKWMITTLQTKHILFHYTSRMISLCWGSAAHTENWEGTDNFKNHTHPKIMLFK